MAIGLLWNTGINSCPCPQAETGVNGNLLEQQDHNAENNVLRFEPLQPEGRDTHQVKSLHSHSWIKSATIKSFFFLLIGWADPIWCSRFAYHMNVVIFYQYYRETATDFTHQSLFTGLRGFRGSCVKYKITTWNQKTVVLNIQRKIPVYSSLGLIFAVLALISIYFILTF